MRIVELTTNLKHTVPAEYQAIKSVLITMQNRGLESISWRDFQKAFQSTAQKYADLIQTIRKNRPEITQKDLADFLQNYKQPKKFDISYDKYFDPKTSFRAVKQTVMQINRNAAMNKAIAKDRLLNQYLQMVGQSSIQSGHPVQEKTIGWIRLDEVNTDWLLIDEIQSDLINSVTQAKSILQCKTYEEFEATLPPEGKKMLRDKVSKQQFYQAKKQIPQAGYTPQALDTIKSKMVKLFEDWLDEAMSSIIEVAHENNFKFILLHTAETISQRDPLIGQETNKMKMFYDNLAKSHGFRKQEIEIPELHGMFWIRNLQY